METCPLAETHSSLVTQPSDSIHAGPTSDVTTHGSSGEYDPLDRLGQHCGEKQNNNSTMFTLVRARGEGPGGINGWTMVSST